MTSSIDKLLAKIAELGKHPQHRVCSSDGVSKMYSRVDIDTLATLGEIIRLQRDALKIYVKCNSRLAIDSIAESEKLAKKLCGEE